MMVCWLRAASCLLAFQGRTQLICPISGLMMCAKCVHVSECAGLLFDRRRETYTCIVELIGFDHGYVVWFGLLIWCAKVEMLSVNKSCAMKRACWFAYEQRGYKQDMETTP